MTDMALSPAPVPQSAQHPPQRNISPFPKQIFRYNKGITTVQKRAAPSSSDSIQLVPPAKYPAPIYGKATDSSLRAALNTHTEILFEEFDLLQHDGTTRILTWAEDDTIISLFPTTWSCEQGMLYLVLRCKNLPPRPWPYAIAGMPLYITDSPTEQPQAYAGLTGRGARLFPEYKGRVEAHLEEMIREFFNVLVREFEELQTEDSVVVKWYGVFFQVELPFGFDIRRYENHMKLPGRIAELQARYANMTVNEVKGRLERL